MNLEKVFFFIFLKFKAALDSEGVFSICWQFFFLLLVRVKFK